MNIKFFRKTFNYSFLLKKYGLLIGQIKSGVGYMMSKNDLIILENLYNEIGWC